LFNILMEFYNRNYLLKFNINHGDDICCNSINSNNDTNYKTGNGKNIVNSGIAKKNIYKKNFNILNAGFNCHEVLNDGDYFNYTPTLEWKKKFARLYLKFMIYFKGEDKAVKEFRKYLTWIFKGLAGVKEIRRDFYLIDTYDKAVKAIKKL